MVIFPLLLIGGAIAAVLTAPALSRVPKEEIDPWVPDIPGSGTIKDVTEAATSITGLVLAVTIHLSPLDVN